MSTTPRGATAVPAGARFLGLLLLLWCGGAATAWGGQPLFLSVMPGGGTLYEVVGDREIRLATPPLADRATMVLQAAEGSHTFRFKRPPFDDLTLSLAWDPLHHQWLEGGHPVGQTTVFAMRRSVHFRVFPGSTVFAETGADEQVALVPKGDDFVVPAAWDPPPLHFVHAGFKPYLLVIPRGALGRSSDLYPDRIIWLIPWFGPFSYWQFDIVAGVVAFVGYRRGWWRARRRPVAATPRVLGPSVIASRPPAAAAGPEPKSVTTTFVRFLNRLKIIPRGAPPSQRALETRMMSDTDLPRATATQPMPLEPLVQSTIPMPTREDPDAVQMLQEDLGADLSPLAVRSLASENGRRFRLQRVIGRSDGAIILAASQLGGRSEPATVKLLRGDQFAAPGLHEQFNLEMRALTILTHPHLAEVLDWGFVTVTDGGLAHPFVVMERLNGSSLRDILNLNPGVPLQTADAAKAAVQMLKGLELAHLRQVFHGHMKPENVFILGKGQVRLVDFGLAGGHADAATVSPYQPPQGAGVDVATDLYGVGVILYEMLTGSVPVDAAATVPGLRPSLSEVVQRMRAPEADARYPTAAEARAALTSA